MVITGTRKGIGRQLVRHYAQLGFAVIGCSRGDAEETPEGSVHFCLDVADEQAVQAMFREIRQSHGHVDVLINNAGVASMNHALLTPAKSVERILATNVAGAFLFCREAAKLMRKRGAGRIVNFSTVAVPLRLEGEAVYAASKAAVETLTRVLAREFGSMGITVNAVGPTPIQTDLIRGVSKDKLDRLLNRQAIVRMGEMRDVTNLIDFFIRPESDFVSGQVVYLGGV